MVGGRDNFTATSFTTAATGKGPHQRGATFLAVPFNLMCALSREVNQITTSQYNGMQYIQSLNPFHLTLPGAAVAVA